MARVGWIGLGAMGERMVRHLLADHDVVVHNRTRARAAALLANGAEWAASPRAAAEGAEVVISMVTDDGASEAVWLHPESGALQAVSPGALVMECSTLTPDWTRRLGAAVDDVGATFLDAPVAGSTPQAEQAQLAFLVGGDVAQVERARPLMASMGRVVVHAGERSHGAVLKLAVNTLFASQVAVMAELLAMFDTEGVNVERAVQQLVATPIASPAMGPVSALMLASDHAPRFPVDLVAKDLGYAVSARKMPVAEAVRAQFEATSVAGHGAANLTAVRLLL